jgi:hypothetical protein
MDFSVRRLLRPTSGLVLFGILLAVGVPARAVAQTGDSATSTPPGLKKPKKKKPKAPDAPAPAEAAPAEVAPVPSTPPVAPVAPVAPEPAPPTATGSAAASSGSAPDGDPAGSHTSSSQSSDVEELPNQTYYFVGLHYRGTIIPQFMENIFISQGSTVYSNSVGAELDIRRNGLSLIPSITYANYSFGDTLFLQKGTDPSQEFNYSDVNSGLQAIYAGADLLKSVEISKAVSFEFGAGLGVGVVFGSLHNDWVTAVPSGGLLANTGVHYAPCTATSTTVDSGCNPQSHTSPNPVKVNGYTEPTWLSGGSIPVIFPQVSLPELGIRYKPIKQLETRFTVGFSITGFFFQLSADYGFEKATHEPTTK